VKPMIKFLFGIMIGKIHFTI